MSIYRTVNPTEKSEIEAGPLVQFLMSSGLDPPQLKQLWSIAARTSNSYLLKEEFFVVLRLVAYVQN